MSSTRITSKVISVLIRTTSDGDTHLNDNISVLIAMDEEVNEYKIFVRADNKVM